MLVIFLAIFVVVIALLVWVSLKLEKIDRRLGLVIPLGVGFLLVASEISDHRYWRALFYGGFFLLVLTPPWFKSALTPSWMKFRVPRWWNTPIGELIDDWKSRHV